MGGKLNEREKQLSRVLKRGISVQEIDTLEFTKV